MVLKKILKLEYLFQTHSIELLKNMKRFIESYPESEDPETIQLSTAGLVKSSALLLNMSVSKALLHISSNKTKKNESTGSKTIELDVVNFSF